MKGHRESQYYLGAMYARGKGILEVDRPTGYSWLNLAAAQGHEDAILEKELVAEKMSQGEIDAAQKHSSELHYRINRYKK
jgi:TPR repeat protein